MAWWFYQSAASYDRENWWNPFHTYSVGTTVVQWGLLILLLLLINRAWAARVGAREDRP
jgi:NSS family neurotransmitter:Na+ symporter